jgi:transposase InsO family protein
MSASHHRVTQAAPLGCRPYRVRDRPGELIHVDVKKRAGTSTGYRFLHSALNDRTRLVYSEIHTSEQAVNAVAFRQRANTWFQQHDITVERVLTDNGPCYRSRLWSDTLTDAAITPKFTRPFRPQTNGKIERFHRILLEEWAYIRDWHTDHERTTHHDHFIHFYNHHRAHGALKWATPMSTLKDNVPGMHNQRHVSPCPAMCRAACAERTPSEDRSLFVLGRVPPHRRLRSHI